MHIDRILEDFAHPDGLPKIAIRAARRQRERITPVFLDCLSKSAESDGELDDNDRALFFVIFLLAEFREQRAFRPLMKLLGREPERVDRILGDAITESLSQIVLSVFDGDIAPIHQVIENAEADEFVRDAMFDVLTALALTGRLDRAWMKRFLLRCYAELEPQKDSQVWIAWYQAIAALGLVELHQLVRKAYHNGFISHEYAGWHHIDGDLKQPVADEELDAWLESHRGLPIEDTVEILKTWHFARSRDPLTALGLGVANPGTQVNRYRDVGRNDPCPCGSGKKYKKCCLDNQAAA